MESLRYGHNMQIRDKFLKIHTTHVFDTRDGHASDITQLHDKSVHATYTTTITTTTIIERLITLTPLDYHVSYNNSL